MPSFLRFTEPRRERQSEEVEERHSIARQSRRFLMVLLTMHLVLLFLVFPIVFVYVESSLFAPGVDSAVDIEDTTWSSSLVHALYWSVITPISLDLNGWPQTPAGRLLVRISDVTKLLVVLVGADLLYHSLSIRLVEPATLTPRSVRANGERRHAPIDGQAEAGDGKLNLPTRKKRELVARIILLLMQKDDPTKHNGHR